MKAWYSAKELVALPGMPESERHIRRVAKKNLWGVRPKVRGKGIELALATLPEITKQALISRELSANDVSATKTSPVALPETVTSQPISGRLTPSALTDKQRAGSDARKSVLQAIETLMASAGCGREPAMTTLLTTARSGKLDVTLDSMLKQARDSRGRAGDGYPSIRTLKRWLSASDLAPKVAQKDMTPPVWAQPLLKLYGRPQKPSLSACMEDLSAHLPPGTPVPSYHAARRFLEKLGAIEKQRGRSLPRELKNIMPFVRRDTSILLPGDYYTADGHTFDAEVAHPDHGRPFRPEITSVLDIATRKCVGWSAGLAESTWTVLDAQRNAIETHGIPAGWYVDNGSGFANIMQSDEVAGFAARVGFQIHHSLPYGSQARGVEERSHQSIWIRAAKTLPTYIGADMDPEAKQKVFKITRAHIKQIGRSKLLIEWDRFVSWCQDVVEAYNNRPHRSLPRIRDASGKLRHQSPNESWAAALQGGWMPTMLTSGESVDLFRPEKICTVLRGEIRFRNNLYFSRDLQEWHGQRLRVGYDIHDASRVWVRDMEGRLITIAQFEANKRAYFPQAVIDQDRAKRAAGRERRLEVALQEVRDELTGTHLLEHQPTSSIPVQILGNRDEVAILRNESTENCIAEAEICNVVSLPGVAERPWFNNDPDQYRWLMRNPAQWDAQDADWLLAYVASDDYKDLEARYAYQGVAWGNDDEQRAQDKLDSEVAAR